MKWVNKNDTRKIENSWIRKLSKVLCACFLVKCRKDKPTVKKSHNG